MKPRENVPLDRYTTLGVGGPALYFVEAKTEADVPPAVEMAAERQVPLFVLGGGSNLLVSDAGFPGLVLKIALEGIEEISVPPGKSGRTGIRVGAGESWDGFVAHCVGRDLGGVECLSGIPGTVGGTPVQNVGAYGQEVSDVIARVRAWDRPAGRIVELDADECGFAYRASRFNTSERERYIILSVDYALTPGAPANLDYRDVARYFEERGAASMPTLAEVREAVREIRRAKAMLLVPDDPDCRSAGSFFRNPIVTEAEYAALEGTAGAGVPRFPAGEAGRVKVPAAWLIERAGFARGYRRGGAAISSRHTLAIVNRHKASAREIVDLAREIRDGVKQKFGVTLVPEPVFLGFRERF